jgi:uncharacterized protein (DUF952 family)
MKNNNEFIYHVISQIGWNKISESEFYAPDSLTSDGFIHFSYKDQIPGVIERYYKNQTDLLVIKVEVNKLKSNLLLEKVPGTGLFPHLYGKLNLDSVIGVFQILKDENNKVFWSESY